MPVVHNESEWWSNNIERKYDHGPPRLVMPLTLSIAG